MDPHACMAPTTQVSIASYLCVMEIEEVVVIVGAGPAGLATSVCLSQLSIPHVILEKEDCPASLWKKRAYDRLHLHIAKHFCELPFMPHSPKIPTFMPKDDFIRYLDSYVTHFDVNPRLNRVVESAVLDEPSERWRVEARNMNNGEVEVYVCKFLVVATGENSEAFVPQFPGMESFQGEIFHSSEYKNGKKFKGKDVLVIGCGNSGMEISYDLVNSGASTSIVIRSPIHVLTKEMVHFGMKSVKFFPVQVVDGMLNILSKLEFGDLSGYGLTRPFCGPFYLKLHAGRAPVIDVGAVQKIRSGEIRVVPAIVSINGDTIEFEDRTKQHFDAIVCATGYKSAANKWLKDYKYIFNDQGMPKNSFPDQWKGKHGIYCVGFTRMGIQGISIDAKLVAKEIRDRLVTSMEREEAPVAPEIMIHVSPLILQE